MIRRLFSRARQRLPFLNIWLAAFALMANQYLVQGFCQPVLWAGIVFALSIGAFLAWPWLHSATRVVRYAALFLQGVAFTVCCYCAWFISLQPELYLIGFLFWWLLVPGLAWVPVFFGAQLLRRVQRTELVGRWPVFLVGVFALAPALWWARQQYQQLEKALSEIPLPQRKSLPVLVRTLPRSYMLERVAGAAFIYHTRPEFIFDGWQPPLHDPLFVICLALPRHSPVYSPGYSFLLALDLDDADDYRHWVLHRQQLYHALFPGRPVKADCVCSHNRNGESYRRWNPLKP